MNKEQELQFKENIREIAKQEIKNSFTDNLMETLNSAFIFKYVETLEHQVKKQKEVIDKIEKYIEKQTRMYGLSMSIELGTHLDNILGILKEVSE